MHRAPRNALLLAAVAAGLACGDATGPADQPAADVLIAATGLSSDAAGLVLRLDGSVTDVAAVGADIDLVWIRETSGTTVALVGPLANGAPLVRVRGMAPGMVAIVEIARVDGSVMQAPAGARAVATAAQVDR